MSHRESFMDRFNLRGKVALVTGASRGLGPFIASGLAEAGADVIITARTLSKLEKVAEEISRLGRRSLPVVADLRHLNEINNIVNKALNEFGHIDILVNNAANYFLYGSVFDIDEKIWNAVMELNLKGYFFLAQAVARIMRQKGGGNIINISSLAGIKPSVGLGVYSISKAGIIMLTQVLAQECGQYNIRVNTIAPGTLKTKSSEMRWKSPEMAKRVANEIVLGRPAEPEEMVNAALFLASDASSYMTGQIIVLDGGHFASVGTGLRSLHRREE